MEQKDKIEIPFGAFDSEFGGFEYTIPEGYEAEIKDGKVIVKKAENEDEKIRKEITELIMQPTWKTEKEFHRRRELCTWLEKQGEQKVIVPKFRVGDKVRLKGSCGWYNVTEIRSVEYYLTSNEVVPCLLPICEQDDWEVEKKPVEWSEEDKRALSDAIVALSMYAFGDIPNIPPSQMLEDAERLKSLRPQSHWKPTEEQMNELYHVSKGLVCGKSDCEVLNTLYEQLKEL